MTLGATVASHACYSGDAGPGGSEQTRPTVALLAAQQQHPAGVAQAPARVVVQAVQAAAAEDVVAAVVAAVPLASTLQADQLLRPSRQSGELCVSNAASRARQTSLVTLSECQRRLYALIATTALTTITSAR
jgi:hypothetical protein